MAITKNLNIMFRINYIISSIFLVPTCPRGESAECCDTDGSCSDGDDDWCCDAVFYCSNDGVDYATKKGGILCPGNDNNNEDAIDDNNSGNDM